MAIFQNRKEQWRTEYKKFKNLTARNKFIHIWDYYKLPLISILLFGLLLFYVGDMIYQSRIEIVLQGFFTNDDFNLFDAKVLDEEFSDYIDLEKDRRIVFDDSLYIDFDSSDEYIASSQGKIVAYLAAKELDFIVTNKEIANHYITQISFYDMTELLPEELYVKLSDKFYYQDGADGVKRAYGIDLSLSRFMKDAQFDNLEPYYLIIPTAIPHKEMLFAFLEYAFDER